MKVIDLLNKIANGKINEDTLIEFDNGYRDCCSVRIFFDRYIVDRENLNCEVEIIQDILEEDKKIEHINKVYDLTDFRKDYPIVAEMLKDLSNKQYEIIDKVNGE